MQLSDVKCEHVLVNKLYCALGKFEQKYFLKKCFVRKLSSQKTGDLI